MFSGFRAFRAWLDRFFQNLKTPLAVDLIQGYKEPSDELPGISETTRLLLTQDELEEAITNQARYLLH